MAEEEVSVRKFDSISEARRHVKGIATGPEHLRVLWPWPFGDEDHHPNVDHHDGNGFVDIETRACHPGGEFGNHAKGTQTRSVWIDSQGRRDAGALGECVPNDISS